MDRQKFLRKLMVAVLSPLSHLDQGRNNVDSDIYQAGLGNVRYR